MPEAACCELSDIPALKRTLSAGRIGYWRMNGKHDDAGALILHKRNMFVSSAFYADLQTLEIALRNLLDGAFQRTFSQKDWWDEAAFQRKLDADGTSRADRIRDDICYAKRHAKAWTHDKILIELSLGFWVAVVHSPPLWSGCVETCFQYENLGKQTIRAHLRTMLNLRNRIAHHEPVLDGPMESDFAKLTMLVRSLCPVTAKWLNRHSLVPKILKVDWLELTSAKGNFCADGCSLNVFLTSPFAPAD
jgi:hypothetical protein